MQDYIVEDIREIVTEVGDDIVVRPRMVTRMRSEVVAQAEALTRERFGLGVPQFVSRFRARSLAFAECADILALLAELKDDDPLGV